MSRSDRPVLLPSGLAGMGPGVDLGLALATIDRDRLSQPDRVTVMQAWARQLAHAQAELYVSMNAVAEAVAETAGGDFELAQDLAASEIRAALTWTRRAADAQLDLARDLLERYPRVWEALHRERSTCPRPGSSSNRPLISTRRPPDRWPTSPWSGPDGRPPVSSGRGSTGW